MKSLTNTTTSAIKLEECRFYGESPVNIGVNLSALECAGVVFTGILTQEKIDLFKFAIADILFESRVSGGWISNLPKDASGGYLISMDQIVSSVGMMEKIQESALEKYTAQMSEDEAMEAYDKENPTVASYLEDLEGE